MLWVDVQRELWRFDDLDAWVAQSGSPQLRARDVFRGGSQVTLD